MLRRDSMRTAGGTASPGAGIDIHDAGQNLPSPVPGSLRAPIDAPGEPPKSAAVYDPSRFVDGTPLVFTFGGAGDQLVLQRPTKGQRVFLLIVNDLAAGVIRVNWDSPASATVGIPIGVGGNLFMDETVFQNDVHVFAPGAGNIQIAHAITDTTNPAKILNAA